MMNPQPPFAQNDGPYSHYLSNEISEEYGEDPSNENPPLDVDYHEHELPPVVPPAEGMVSDLQPQINQSEEDENEEAEAEITGGEEAPWTVDWKEKATNHLKTALEDYKRSAKSLYEAIVTFVDESNEIHKEWSVLQEEERAESRRLDEVEPDVLNATHGEEYGDIAPETSGPSTS